MECLESGVSFKTFVVFSSATNARRLEVSVLPSIFALASLSGIDVIFIYLIVGVIMVFGTILLLNRFVFKKKKDKISIKTLLKR